MSRDFFAGEYHDSSKLDGKAIAVHNFTSKLLRHCSVQDRENRRRVLNSKNDGRDRARSPVQGVKQQDLVPEDFLRKYTFQAWLRVAVD
jgi:hypothetical protein